MSCLSMHGSIFDVFGALNRFRFSMVWGWSVVRRYRIKRFADARRYAVSGWIEASQWDSSLDIPSDSEALRGSRIRRSAAPHPRSERRRAAPDSRTRRRVRNYLCGFRVTPTLSLFRGRGNKCSFRSERIEGAFANNQKPREASFAFLSVCFSRGGLFRGSG